MNELCVVLLIAVAEAIGRLWPRKHSPQPVPQPAPSPHEYGLFLPPDCDEVEFKDVLQYSTYHREYPKDKSYDFITIRNPANITVLRNYIPRKKKIALLPPIGRNSKELKKECHEKLTMTEQHLIDCQLPNPVPIMRNGVQIGGFHKPTIWP